MTEEEVDAIIDSVWLPEASLQLNLRALVRIAASYGWRCAQVAHWLKKDSIR
jgi:hypothetical protein